MVPELSRDSGVGFVIFTHQELFTREFSPLDTIDPDRFSIPPDPVCMIDPEDSDAPVLTRPPL